MNFILRWFGVLFLAMLAWLGVPGAAAAQQGQPVKIKIGISYPGAPG